MQSLLFELELESETKEEGSLKKCTKCHEHKEEEEFPWRGGENYRRTECKKCRKKLASEAKTLRDLYGNPPDDHRCPICDRTEEEVKGQGGKKCTPWVIDHDHKTNTFRGWLCHKCNRGLGAFNDNLEILEKVIDYLKKK